MAFGSASRRSIQLSYGCSHARTVAIIQLDRASLVFLLPASPWQLSYGCSSMFTRSSRFRVNSKADTPPLHLLSNPQTAQALGLSVRGGLMPAINKEQPADCSIFLQR